MVMDPDITDISSAWRSKQIAPVDLSASSLLLSMRMVADELDDVPASYTEGNISEKQILRSVRIFDPRMADYSRDTVYFLMPGQGGTFPVDQYPYITTDDLPGGAEHICCVAMAPLSLFNLLLRFFERCHTFENALNDVIAGDGSLDDMCRIGYTFLRNPMYIHDRYFTVISLPFWVQGMLKFEYNEMTGKYYIPLALIEDFKFNEGYHETLAQKQAAIWGTEQYPYGMRSLYVNLWDDNVYRGRLLINEINTPLTRSHFAFAEFLASKVISFLKMHSERGAYKHRSYEDTIRSLLTKGVANSADVTSLLTSVSWEEQDTFVCVRVRPQNPDLTITSNTILRARMDREFQGSISFLEEDGICMLINITRSNLTVSDISHTLSPIARDSLLYIGISSPVKDLYALRYAFGQAQAALDITSRRKDMHWVLPFETCALEYMGAHINSELPDMYLVSSSLLRLQSFDREKGTDYLKTLRVYLEDEQNIPKASADLIIHRTTLLYRLGKIRELISVNLNDPDVRLYLLISFRLLDRCSKAPAMPEVLR